MIRVGIGKPKLYFVQGTNDMSHWHASHWTVPDYFWMCVEDYMQKRDFETFDMKPKHITPKEIERILELGHKKEKLTLLDSPWGYRMQELIKRSGGMLWQFDAVNYDFNDWIRQVVVLGEPRMHRWTWFDAHVKLPACILLCNILNKLRHHKVRKECEDWETYVNEVHAKHKTEGESNGA